MLKAESTIGIILVLIFGMSLGFATNQLILSQTQDDLIVTQNDIQQLTEQNIEQLKNNLQLEKKILELSK